MPVRYPVIRRIDAWAPILVFALLFASFVPVRLLGATELWINEVMFNPPGTNNVPHQYVELRGTPNLLLTNVYFVAVEGDTNGNPGSIENVFNLAGFRIGGNGFLVLLQNSNRYLANTSASVVMNTNGPGFGSGSGSSAQHRGKNGQVAFQSASTTFFLINANTPPAPGDDIDTDDDGVPDGAEFAEWAILDSVGVLDNNGFGDFAYGQINFRRSQPPGNTAIAAGTIVPIDFTAGYVARVKNSTNWTAADWCAADELGGAAPRWTLVAGHIHPATIRSGTLNNLGAPNFGGPKTPGAVLRTFGTGETTEGGPAARYLLGLNVPCRKGITIQLDAPSRIELSTDNGRSYAASRTLKLTSTRPKKVLVRQVNDDAVGPWRRPVEIVHTVLGSADPLRYPADATIVPPATLIVNDDDTAVLSELKVNPPGPEDGPFEFAELRGTPNARLDNVSLLAVIGDVELNPGTVSVVDLSGQRIGVDGLLFIAAPGHPYLPAAGTPVVIAPQLGQAPGGFNNGTVTFLLVHTMSSIAEGVDLDEGDNGKLEKLPADVSILDSVGWKGGSGGVDYTPAIIDFSNGVPDAASRFKNDNRPSIAAAWFAGNLGGTNGESVTYDEQRVTANFPFGTVLSPGTVNNSAPQISEVPPFSSVIGDRTVPPIMFTVGDAESSVNSLNVTVQGSNDVVLPNGSLTLSGSGSNRTLVVQPAGVGYATITISVSDGQASSSRVIPYAASTDWIGGGRFHSGASDGSTAFAIDSRWMLVGDDENQRIRLYSRSNSGPPIALFDMSSFLALNDFYDNGSPKEVDIEGSTHVGNRIYWLGSHSHAGDAQIRTNRARIFATDIAGSGTNVTLTYVGRYEYLKYDLLNWDAHGEHGKPDFYYGLGQSSAEGIDPKDTNGIGFNMEGLAMAPNSTNIGYLGFRAPLVPPTNRVHALVVPVTNFASLAASEAPPSSARFGTPIELNLGGRGIRSFEAIGTNYLIVAGPPGVASGIPPSDFKLFTWSGHPADQPQQLSAEFPNLNVEAIVALPKLPWTSNSMVQLLSDNGIQVYYNDDIQAKHLPIREFKKFRTDWIRMGHVVTPQPFIRAAVKEEDAAMTITWHSFAGVTYRVQSKAALSDPEWIDLEGDVTATSATSVKVVEPGDSRKFFRIIALE